MPLNQRKTAATKAITTAIEYANQESAVATVNAAAVAVRKKGAMMSPALGTVDRTVDLAAVIANENTSNPTLVIVR